MNDIIKSSFARGMLDRHAARARKTYEQADCASCARCMAVESS